MGGNSHSRLVRLWTESATVEREYRDPFGRRSTQTVIYGDGTVPADVTPARTTLTPVEAWRNVSDQEGWEDGHSYSGTFGSKHGMIVFGTADVDVDTLAVAGRIVEVLEYGGNGDPYDAIERQTACDVQEMVPGTSIGHHPYGHALPSGGRCSGWRALTAAETAAERAKVDAAIAAFGRATLDRAALQYGDKWGEAVGLVGRDHVWFGGVCSS